MATDIRQATQDAIEAKLPSASAEDMLFLTKSMANLSGVNVDFSHELNDEVIKSLDDIKKSNELVIYEGVGQVGSIVSSSSRQSVYSSGEWSSSAAWTTYYNTWQDANSRTQGFNMLMGDGMPEGTTHNKFVNDGQSNEHRKLEFATGNRLGHYYKDRFEYDNATGNYSGITLRCMPVRNTTDKAITRTIGASRTGSGSNYGGHSTLVWTPNTAEYETTDGGNWSVVNDTNSTGESNYNNAFTITIPANTTILIVNTSGWWYPQIIP